MRIELAGNTVTVTRAKADRRMRYRLRVEFEHSETEEDKFNIMNKYLTVSGRQEIKNDLVKEKAKELVEELQEEYDDVEVLGVYVREFKDIRKTPYDMRYGD